MDEAIVKSLTQGGVSGAVVAGMMMFVVPRAMSLFRETTQMFLTALQVERDACAREHAAIVEQLVELRRDIREG